MRSFLSYKLYLLLLLLSKLRFVHGDDIASLSNSTPTEEMGLNLTLSNPILQEQFDRFLDILNGEAAIYNETEYADRFAPSFIDAAPVDTILAPIIINLRNASDQWVVLEVAQEQANGAVLIIAPEEGFENEARVAVSMLITPADGRINTFLISDASAAELENPPTNVEEAVGQIDDLGHEFNFVIADIVPVENEDPLQSEICQTIAGRNEDDSAPIGSMFKLWVLAALVDSIDAASDGTKDTIQWDQNVTVTEEVKSLPTGIVQDDPVGNQRSVRELAELMISISDNTATDILLHLVGRTTVEKALVGTGHHDPSLNKPFLSTKDLFLLKLDNATGDGRPGPLGEMYLNKATEDARRAILDELKNVTIDRLDMEAVLAWATGSLPIVVEDLEWFASPMDLCRVLARLYRDETARQILSLNPGIPDEQGLWSYIGYKGGSEPGVLGLAWYVVPTEESAQHRVVVGSVWNPESAVEETRVPILLGYLRDLSLNLDRETGSVDSSGVACQYIWSWTWLIICASFTTSIFMQLL